MSISLRVTEKENELIKSFAKLYGESVSEYIRRTVMERIEDEFDLQCYAIAKKEFEENSTTCTTEELAKEVLSHGGYFDAMTGSKINSNELVAALINSKDSYADGIRYAQDRIDGTASILILTDRGTLIAARDKVGRLPVQLGKGEDGYCVSFESFAY